MLTKFNSTHHDLYTTITLSVLTDAGVIVVYKLWLNMEFTAYIKFFIVIFLYYKY